MSSLAKFGPLLPKHQSLELYERFLAAYGENTRRNYEHCLKRFAKWWGMPGVQEAVERFCGLGGPEANLVALSFQNDMVNDGMAPSTVNLSISALRAVAKLGRLIGRCTFHLEVSGVTPEQTRDTRGPGRDAYLEMLGWLEGRTEGRFRRPSVRNIAILRFLHDLGLRRAEVVELDYAHVDLEGRRVSIRGKGRRARQWWPVGRAAWEALERWLDIRGDFEGALFCACHQTSTFGQRLNLSSINRMVTRLGEAVGVAATPHGFRHTAITTVLEKTGGDVRKAQKFSRHADVRMLQIYDDERKDIAREMSDMLGEDDDDEK